jgi:mRNA-degrading endonuclease RelE of RelBE toxin-antitoxin system
MRCERGSGVATVKLSSHAEKALERLSRSDRRLFARIESALLDLAEKPDAGKFLHGPLAAIRSFRVGPLRILYRFEGAQLLVYVLDIAQRGKVYRDEE